jgi:peptidoglycan/xylan/chitin deacetylase (PgdA/CDA1 family)
MQRKRKADRTFLMRLGWGLMVIALLGGCATPKTETPPVTGPSVTGPSVATPPVELRASADFVAITAREGNTFSSLAEKYLNDPSLDWWIADFNDLSTLNPGQSLIIPLKPYEKGGVSLKGCQAVPVLSYHNFSPDRSTNRMTVTKAAFEEQMRLLKDKGYRVITLDQLLGFLNFKSQIPPKSVVITIDDGWRSAFEIAMPILKKYGYPATLFVYTGLIVGSSKTLSWELVREMEENGIDIQGHTITHRTLTSVMKRESFKEYFDAIERELSESAKIIKAKIGKDTKYLAYPDGETNHLVIDLVKKDGYKGAFTVKRGGNPFFAHNFKINRSMIYGDFDLSQFERNLTVFSEWAAK